MLGKPGKVNVCVLMPTHCTVMCFGFCTARIDVISVVLFFIDAPLAQNALHGGGCRLPQQTKENVCLRRNNEADI